MDWRLDLAVLWCISAGGYALDCGIGVHAARPTVPSPCLQGPPYRAHKGAPTPAGTHACVPPKARLTVPSP